MFSVRTLGRGSAAILFLTEIDDRMPAAWGGKGRRGVLYKRLLSTIHSSVGKKLNIIKS
jgi:hypothetical protein